jgi:hypothetical protein
MPILLAFGAFAGVVFGGAGCDDLSVIDVFLGLLVLLSSPRLSYGQDLAAGERTRTCQQAQSRQPQTSARVSS